MSGLGLAETLPQSGLIAITWGCVGLAAIFVACRTAIRIHKIQRLHPDDYMVYSAFALLVVNAVLQTLQTPELYYIAQAQAGLVPLDEILLIRGTTYVKYEFAIIGLFWTVLWLVKASFLTFFYQLFDGLEKYRKIWWAVVVFIILAYVGCWITSLMTCHPVSSYFIFGACDKPIDRISSIISISYSTTVDVLTDLMIIVMPLPLLWRVQISKREKMGLAAVFSIGVVIIVFAVVRSVQILFTARTDEVLLALWGILESSVSVVVACLPTFKSLFSKRPKESGYSARGGRYNNSSTPRSIPLNSYNGATTKVHSGVGQWGKLRGESQDSDLSSPTRIAVRTDVTVVSDKSFKVLGIN